MVELKHQKIFKVKFEGRHCDVCCQALKYFPTSWYCAIFDKLLVNDFTTEERFKILRCPDCLKAFGGENETAGKRNRVDSEHACIDKR